MSTAEGYLIDLDGTLMSGRAALPGAAELVERLGERLIIVSNDAEHTPDQLAGRLRAARLPVPAERIVLAGTTALELVAYAATPGNWAWKSRTSEPTSSCSRATGASPTGS
jgi:ribonucleotide monophosphatase NagD (HAD superfamily)